MDINQDQTAIYQSGVDLAPLICIQPLIHILIYYPFQFEKLYIYIYIYTCVCVCVGETAFQTLLNVTIFTIKGGGKSHTLPIATKERLERFNSQRLNRWPKFRVYSTNKILTSGNQTAVKQPKKILDPYFFLNWKLHKMAEKKTCGLLYLIY